MTTYRDVAYLQSGAIACPSTSLNRFSRIVTRGVNKYKMTKTLIQIPPTSKPYPPPNLGKSGERLAVRSNNIGFCQACVETRSPHEGNQLPPKPHPAATILEDMIVYGVPIEVERGMTKQYLTREIYYGAHSSATKETKNFRTKLAEQTWAGHIALFPL